MSDDAVVAARYAMTALRLAKEGVVRFRMAHHQKHGVVELVRWSLEKAGHRTGTQGFRERRCVIVLLGPSGNPLEGEERAL